MYRNTTVDPPRPVTLAHGQPLAPGEDGPADPELDKALIDAGDLTPVDEPVDKPEKKPAAKRGKKTTDTEETT